MPKTLRGMPRPEGAGRKKGTPNKTTQTLMEKCAELGCDPFDVLLRFAKGDWKGLGYESAQRVKTVTHDGNVIMEDRISEELRQKSARDAAEYIHPKRKALDLSIGEDKGFRVIVQDFTTKEIKGNYIK